MADQPRRVNFFTGMLLTAEDLAVEQEYHREMRYLHNRLHGFGVVSGLDVSVGRGSLRVDPGLAIDPCGREIVVTQPLTVRLAPPQQARRWVRDLVVTWHESPEGLVPALAPGSEDTTAHTRWVELPELSLVAAGKAAAEAVVLARLSRTPRGAVEVDASVRRPLAPAGYGGGGRAGAS
ncbi:hypothetical protein [Pedococcus bigeumensis]|uniref:hypothetical protein n=1 Tax=Pedococcus bigeumensis TaxID=433644 RepID=UPI002FEBA158